MRLKGNFLSYISVHCKFHVLHLLKIIRIADPDFEPTEDDVIMTRTTGIVVTEILDVTPVPHNGCRAPKRRRV